MRKALEKRMVLALLIGFLLGIFWLGAVRFALYDRKDVHYHANFAMYLDGEQQPFDSFAFYEEVQSCGGDDLNNPRIRVHMHDQISHVVHVHDEAATWGHFFSNLGFVLADNMIQTSDKQFYVDGDEQDGEALTFILNGEKVRTIANQTIRSEDVLLINFGNDDDVAIEQRYEDIMKDAAEYNLRADPSACSGSEPVTFTERLKAAFGFN